MRSILTLNSGSSSVKFSAYTIGEHNICKTFVGMVDRVTTAPIMRIKDTHGKIVFESNLSVDPSKQDPYEFTFYEILHQLEALGIEVVAAGHRVIHGAMKYRAPTIVDAEKIKFFETFNPLAPLHQPYNLKGIQILTNKFPNILQVACFDTAFHTTCNELTQLFAIPKWLTEEGVRRYGFHGLSYEYIVSQFDNYLPPEKASGKIIILHLGQGASMCGVVNRKSFTTSLSFSALDGLPMGTRCGCFDPGAMLYLMEHYKMDYKRLERLFYKESGLLGVSGISSDMRTLLESEEPDAKLAVDLFAYRIGGWIGTLAAEMQGVDGLIFTAGIGENAPQIREKVCEHAAWLGAKIDLEKNAKNCSTIHHSSSKLSINVIPTDEELMIAEHTFKALKKGA